MGGLRVKEKEFVVPGQVLVEGVDYVPGSNTYRSGERIYSKKVGLVYLKGSVVKVVALKGTYEVKPRDEVVGIIEEASGLGWLVDIGGPHIGYLPLTEYGRYVDINKVDPSELLMPGDFVHVQVQKVTKDKNVRLTMRGPKLRKLRDGIIHRISPQKVPRLIGKRGSMINLIKKGTNCEIIVGPNGLVWIRGPSIKNELKAVRVIRIIQEESHKEGLTEKIQKMLGVDQ